MKLSGVFVFLAIIFLSKQTQTMGLITLILVIIGRIVLLLSNKINTSVCRTDLKLSTQRTSFRVREWK